MTLKITDQIKIKGQFVNYVYQVMFKSLYIAYFSRHPPLWKTVGSAEHSVSKSGLFCKVYKEAD